MATQGLLRPRVGAVDADSAVQLGVRAPIAAASSGPGMGRDNAGPPPAAADTVAKDGLDCGVLLRRRAGTGASGGPTSSAVVSPLGLLPHQVHVTTHQVPASPDTGWRGWAVKRRWRGHLDGHWCCREFRWMDSSPSHGFGPTFVAQLCLQT
ncbi:uncharacterized protein LOC120669969 [Panicum virgatum]|uniref:uncharacterized protein LOC120669969 n=1 Tax=Panicum virgatum TaxID=38727 RepID=UPI0019D5BAE8|nr:uncharacterized protein LOC120669969 [Panicum virgatum]